MGPALQAQTDSRETLSKMLQLKDIPLTPAIIAAPLHEMPDVQIALVLSWHIQTIKFSLPPATRMYAPARRGKLIHKI